MNYSYFELFNSQHSHAYLEESNSEFQRKYL